MHYVIGSGPAGVACAMALTARGEEVTMLDAGLTLRRSIYCWRPEGVGVTDASGVDEDVGLSVSAGANECSGEVEGVGPPWPTWIVSCCPKRRSPSFTISSTCCSPATCGVQGQNLLGRAVAAKARYAGAILSARTIPPRNRLS